MSFGDLLSDVDGRVRSSLSAGRVVSYRSGIGEEVTISAIFDDVYQGVSPDTGLVTSSSPQVFARLEDLTSDPRDDGAARVFVDAVEYQIRDPQFDGLGGILLPLHKVGL